MQHIERALPFSVKLYFWTITKETCKTKCGNLPNCWIDWIFPSPFGKGHLFLLLLGCPLGAGYLYGKWYSLELISNALGALCFLVKKSRNQHCCLFPNAFHVLFKCGCGSRKNISLKQHIAALKRAQMCWDCQSYNSVWTKQVFIRRSKGKIWWIHWQFCYGKERRSLLAVFKQEEICVSK